jgi:hypothetical protein
MRNLTTSDKFNQLVEDAFYSRTFDKVVVVRDDEKLWDLFAEVVLTPHLNSLMIDLLHYEWFEEQVLAMAMDLVELEGN